MIKSYSSALPSMTAVYFEYNDREFPGFEQLSKIYSKDEDMTRKKVTHNNNMK